MYVWVDPFICLILTKPVLTQMTTIDALLAHKWLEGHTIKAMEEMNFQDLSAPATSKVNYALPNEADFDGITRETVHYDPKQVSRPTRGR